MTADATGGFAPPGTACPDPVRARRILWLVNHTTLRDFEVPLLVGLGYEVFTPKRFPLLHRSASATYEWDATLTIPREELELLNEFDFYDARLDPVVRDVLNRRFGVAIPSYYLGKLDQLLVGFEGHIVLRAFGLMVHGQSYFSAAENVLRPGFRQRLTGALDRFWFGQAYPNLMDIEPELVRRRAVTLPLGLPKEFWSQQGSWTGGQRQILFVCPDIKSYAVSEADYRNFKRVFGDLPHVIAGRQHEKIHDPAVLGLIPRSAYDSLMRESAAMYYPSREPRHLHYHPLEAVCFGMPLIFMRDGMLGRLGGRDLPGACDTAAEARRKLERLLNGDQVFRDEVLATQPVLLDAFRDEPSRVAWKSWLASLPPKPDPTLHRQRRVALLIGENQPTEVREAAFSLAHALLEGAREAGEDLRVVIGVPPDPDSALVSQADRHASSFAATGADPRIDVRRVEWRPMNAAEVRVSQDLSGHLSPVLANDHRAPFDGVASFQDCNFWLIVTAFLDHPIAPVRRFALMLTDSRDWGPGSRAGRGSRQALVATARTASAILSPNEAVLVEAEQTFGLGERWYSLMSLPTAPQRKPPGRAEASRPLGIVAEHAGDTSAIRASLRAAKKIGTPQSDVVVALVDEGWSAEAEESLLEELFRQHGSLLQDATLSLDVQRVTNLENLAREMRALILPRRVSHAAKLFQAASERDCALVFPVDVYLERLARASGTRFATFAMLNPDRIACALKAVPEASPEGVGAHSGGSPTAIWQEVRRLL